MLNCRVQMKWVGSSSIGNWVCLPGQCYALIAGSILPIAWRGSYGRFSWFCYFAFGIPDVMYPWKLFIAVTPPEYVSRIQSFSCFPTALESCSVKPCLTGWHNQSQLGSKPNLSLVLWCSWWRLLLFRAVLSSWLPVEGNTFIGL